MASEHDAQLDLVESPRNFGGDTAYTPIPVARQHLDFGINRVLREREPPGVILCPTAGVGPWAQACRERWPEAEIIGIEINPREIAELGRHCDRAICGDATIEVPRLIREGYRFDLVIDNPPWSNFGEWPSVLRPALVSGGVLALYGPRQWGQAQSTYPVLCEWPPAFHALTGGRVSHNASGKGDQRETSVRWWYADTPPTPVDENGEHLEPEWITRALKIIDGDDRKWGAR